MRKRQREFLDRSRGSLVALPTPLRGGALDIDSFEGLVAFQARHATRGIVLATATGEGPTLRRGEREELILHAALTASRAARDAGGDRERMLVVAAVGTADTRESAELARDALSAGADAILVATPYYSRPSRHGLLRHLGEIAEHTDDAPILFHNDPERCGLDLEPEAIEELSSFVPGVVGLVEGNARPARVRRVVEACGLSVFGAVDRMIAPFTLHGAHGVMSIAANLVPAEVARLVETAQSALERRLEPGEDPRAAAERMEIDLAPILDALSIEQDPGPLKGALEALGACSAEVRAPLAVLEPENRARLESALTSARLLVPSSK